MSFDVFGVYIYYYLANCLHFLVLLFLKALSNLNSEVLYVLCGGQSLMFPHRKKIYLLIWNTFLWYWTTNHPCLNFPTVYKIKGLFVQRVLIWYTMCQTYDLMIIKMSNIRWQLCHLFIRFCGAFMLTLIYSA